jgi:ubiquinone/menaquinone biosynthesis C-methylase UbiE
MAGSDFKRASRSVWDRMAAGWDDRHAGFEQMTRPVTERMLELLDPRAGETILDLAAGTGIAGFAAAEAADEVIVSDFSPAMVAAAERQAAALGLGNVSCRVLDAEALDLLDRSVDGVLCRWGYMLMADPAAALRETRRVLRPDGRLSLAVFGAPERNPWVALPTAVLRGQGHMPAPTPGAPGILALCDEQRLRALLTDAGFGEIAVEQVAFTWRFAEFDEFWRYLNDAAGAIAMVLAGLSPDELAAVRDEIAAELPPTGPFELEAECLVAAARPRAES